MERISAVTVVTSDMGSAVEFYLALGFDLLYGGPDADFTSFGVGDGYHNLQRSSGSQAAPGEWGRVIFWVDDVDAVYDRVRAAGYRPESAPADAPWGERYFHVRDPDGHELSFARPLDR